MKKLIMLIVVLTFVIVQGYAQKRTADSIDWDKMSENISKSVTQSLENLDIDLSDMQIDLSDMQIDLSDMSEIKMDSNLLKELDNMKMYTYNIERQQDTKAEQRAEREVERARREVERSKRAAERASQNNNKSYAYAYSYSTNESKQSNKASNFEDISNITGVEVVYITKALLGMMPNMDMPGVNIGKVAGKLESLQIYSTEEKGPAILLKRTINKLIQLGSYETLMLVKDSDSKTAFYLKSEGKDKKSELLMVTEDGSDVSVIRMLGNFTIQDIQNLTKGQSIKK